MSGRDSIIRCRLSRLAAELNLSRIPDKFADERAERESHNRTRMWLMCFIMDRCLSIQSGKAWMVQEDAVSDPPLPYPSSPSPPAISRREFMN